MDQTVFSCSFPPQFFPFFCLLTPTTLHHSPTSTRVHPSNSLLSFLGKRGQFTLSLRVRVCARAWRRIWVDHGRCVDRSGGGCCRVFVWVKVDSSPSCGMYRSSRCEYMYVRCVQEAVNILHTFWRWAKFSKCNLTHTHIHSEMLSGVHTRLITLIFHVQ